MVMDLMDLIIKIIVGIIGIIILYKLILRGLVLINDDETGILVKKMFGKELPQGKIIACNGEIAIQADILQPGLHFRIPLLWKIYKTSVVKIKTNEVGLVEAIDGAPMKEGRALGDMVECNQFQDARAFLKNGGCKGPQIGILGPGVYRINTELFKIKAGNVLDVPDENLAILTAKDGIPLPSEYLIAPEPIGDCSNFQNGQAFIENQGHRGVQLETLQPGRYYINTLLFDVQIISIAEVPPGYVAVLRSNVGRELARSELPEIEDPATGFDQALGRGEVVLTTSNRQRGILEEPVAPGKYNLNSKAYTPYLVPTSAITIDWAAEGRREQIPSDEYSNVSAFYALNQISAISRDGFELQVDTRMIIRILPENAPWVIARFGSVDNLIEQIAHPLIDATFRNHAGETDAMEFVHSRAELQSKALEKAQREFLIYKVSAQGLLIAYIHVDAELLETQKKRQIALQQQTQYQQQTAAEQERIALEERKARASMQSDVVRAALSIEIKRNEANAKIAEADGIRDSTKAIADGKAYEISVQGKATADAYESQVKAFGADNLAAIKITEQIGANNIVITPEILVSGSSGEGGMAGACTALIATVLKNREKGEVEKAKTEKFEKTTDNIDNPNVMFED
ncbi:MAG: SPFH domain-containing protein [Candidatus Pacebacteria bacterium]|nr:SPFH domain-containing protein [Candidatus Paceibacterota bacterium]